MNSLPPRMRFARKEIARALEALERVDRAPNVDWAMRCIEKEEQIEDLRDDLAHMRRERDAFKALINGAASK